LATDPATPVPPAPAAVGGALVIAAHPAMSLSRVTRRMVDEVARLTPAGSPGPGVALRDLYALYPDYDIDILAEQGALARASLVVWLHPIHWYSMPPLMKLWLDEVLAFGWAYGPGGTALHGKTLWLAVSTGGPAQSYTPQGHNRHPFDDFLLPYSQTAALTGMRWLPPLVLHGAHQAGDAEIEAHALRLAAALAAWPQALAGAEVPDADCEVPAGARPRPAATAR
jgi:glutathione-regulated potassium-efflux system ancillary protein KefF